MTESRHGNAETLPNGRTALLKFLLPLKSTTWQFAGPKTGYTGLTLYLEVADS